MNRKIWSAAAAVLLAVAVLTGCTEQNAQSQTQKTMVNMPQNALTSENSAPPAESEVDGVKIYPMGEFVPVKSSSTNYTFFYRVTSAKVYSTLKEAGLSAKELSLGYNYIDGNSVPAYNTDGSFPEGSALLLLDAEVKLEGEIPKDDGTEPSADILSPMIQQDFGVDVGKGESLSFQPAIVYNSKAPEKDRDVQYYHLPSIKDGETETFQLGYIFPKKYMKSGNLYVAVVGENTTHDRVIQIEVDTK